MRTYEYKINILRITFIFAYLY